jgi:anti-sigma28 factor (negative regulator of flagellin synthesis)
MEMSEMYVLSGKDLQNLKHNDSYDLDEYVARIKQYQRIGSAQMNTDKVAEKLRMPFAKEINGYDENM